MLSFPTVRQSLRIPPLAMLVFLASTLSGPVAFGQQGATKQDSMVAGMLPEARLTLERGLSAASKRGKPISGKYEVDGGKLQLSVYTASAGHFWEVIVNYENGSIEKAEEIKDGDDLKDAKAQSVAMSKAKQSLSDAIASVLNANPGFRAMRVVPMVSAGHPSADVTVVRYGKFKVVSQRLD